MEAGTVTLGYNLKNPSKDECEHVLHGRYIPGETLPRVPQPPRGGMLTAAWLWQRSLQAIEHPPAGAWANTFSKGQKKEYSTALKWKTWNYFYP